MPNPEGIQTKTMDDTNVATQTVIDVPNVPQEPPVVAPEGDAPVEHPGPVTPTVEGSIGTPDIIPVKHTRFMPIVGEFVRVNKEDPQALFTVVSFEDKGARTKLAVLSDGRKIAVSNLLPPMKREPKVELTLIEIAEQAGADADATPNRRTHSAAAVAYLRAAAPLMTEPKTPSVLPADTVFTKFLRFFGIAMTPTVQRDPDELLKAELIAKALYHANCAE